MELKSILKTEDARINFLKGLIRLSKCDGKSSEEELQFYFYAAKALELNEQQIHELESAWKSDDKLEISFETSEEKMFFFIQAIQLCWIDDSYADVERTEIREIANTLGISLDAIQQVENWVHEGILWNKAGDKLLKLN